MAIELDQDIMVTNMCLKFAEDWANSFQELDRKQSSRRTYVRTRATLYAATLSILQIAFRHTRLLIYCFVSRLMTTM